MLGSTLLSIHNLHVLIDLARSARLAIEEGRYSTFLAQWRSGPGHKDY
jgi:queuine/archaeosine tRNA-ribosyltransferase